MGNSHPSSFKSSCDNMRFSAQMETVTPVTSAEITNRSSATTTASAFTTTNGSNNSNNNSKELLAQSRSQNGYIVCNNFNGPQNCSSLSKYPENGNISTGCNGSTSCQNMIPSNIDLDLAHRTYQSHSEEEVNPNLDVYCNKTHLDSTDSCNESKFRSYGTNYLQGLSDRQFDFLVTADPRRERQYSFEYENTTIDSPGADGVSSLKAVPHSHPSSVHDNDSNRKMTDNMQNDECNLSPDSFSALNSLVKIVPSPHIYQTNASFGFSCRSNNDTFQESSESNKRTNSTINSDRPNTDIDISKLNDFYAALVPVKCQSSCELDPSSDDKEKYSSSSTIQNKTVESPQPPYCHHSMGKCLAPQSSQLSYDISSENETQRQSNEDCFCGPSLTTSIASTCDQYTDISNRYNLPTSLDPPLPALPSQAFGSSSMSTGQGHHRLDDGMSTMSSTGFRSIQAEVWTDTGEFQPRLSDSISSASQTTGSRNLQSKSNSSCDQTQHPNQQQAFIPSSISQQIHLQRNVSNISGSSSCSNRDEEMISPMDYIRNEDNAVSPQGNVQPLSFDLKNRNLSTCSSDSQYDAVVVEVESDEEKENINVEHDKRYVIDFIKRDKHINHGRDKLDNIQAETECKRLSSTRSEGERNVEENEDKKNNGCERQQRYQMQSYLSVYDGLGEGPTMYSAFLCVENAEFTNFGLPFTLKLKEMGIRVFLPKLDLILTGLYLQNLVSVIKERCNSKMLVILSKAFPKSEECIFLINYARMLDPAAHRRSIIPIYIDKNIEGVPSVMTGLSSIYYNAAFRNNYLERKIREALMIPSPAGV